MADLTVRMPALSATMEDALLIAWLVDVGDDVRVGQPIAEVSTDKVDMEVESPYDGVMAALLVEANSEVDLGEPIATVASEEDDLLGGLDLSGQGPSTAAGGSGDQPETVDAGGGGDGDRDATVEDDAGSGSQRIIPAPPPIRHRARRMGIDLAEVTPTGARGQVTRADLARHAEEVAQQEEQPPAAGTADDEATSEAATARTAAAKPTSAARPVERDGAPSDLSTRQLAVRRATARSMTASAQVPQFTLYRRIDATSLLARRAGRSVTTELARALAAALWRNPACNVHWDQDAQRPVQREGVRIGIAVASDDGLVVVGVDDPDADDPDAADARIRSAVRRGREGRLTAGDTTELSSTVSNLGGLGVDRFNALLLPPQATILSVGRVVETPVVIDGRVRARSLMEVGLTVDHRAADGADGAQLLDTFASRIEA